MPEEPRDREQKKLLGLASGVGIEFAAAVAGFALVGLWVDRHYGSGPWGLLIGLALGLIGGTYNLVRESLLATKAAERADRDLRPESEGSESER